MRSSSTWIAARWRGAGRIVLAGAIVAAALVAALGSSSARNVVPAAPASPALTRYSVVHGCYAVSAEPGGAGIASGPFRMQAAALGVYLLYSPAGRYLSDVRGGLAATPSPSTEWRLDGSGTHGFTLTDLGTGAQQAVALRPAAGCALYPEAGVDATGSSFTGASPESDVLGTVEGHAHITAFELFGGDWHCGRPWSPYGAPFALPASCAADQQGTNGEVESFLDYGGATRPPAMHGWPTFVDWPEPTTLAEEEDYYTGVERAWKAGLRIFVTNLVDNEALCNLMTTRTNPCDDMASVRIQSADLYALQDYIDAQSGGPGQGFFRIVTTPFQAREVINQGKLAVIEGIEVSRLFGCGEVNGQPQCGPAQIDAGLQEVERLGVRTFFPVHEFNNAFGGSKMIAGETGELINAGNREETGSFFTLSPCPAPDQDAPQLSFEPTGALSSLLNGPAASLLGGSPAPVYGPGPQCNVQGLTDLGSYLIRQMVKAHLIIQLDHMDSRTATSALAVASAAHYSGVVSAHCCSSPQLFRQVYADGGFISEPVDQAVAFSNIERQDRAQRDPSYHFGFGYGSDMNGLAEQPGPATPAVVRYPFRAYAGNVTFTQEQWGQRTFNLNTDGLANYGLYADWLRDVQLTGGPQVMSDMFQGAEAYLEMWERADGVPIASCLPGHATLSATGLGPRLALGDSAEAALFRGGQPKSRPGGSYRWCVRGSGVPAASVFNDAGRVALIATAAPLVRAGGLRVGSHLPSRGVRRVLSGVEAGRRLRGGARYVYGTRRGRVTFVGVAAASTLAQASRLRAELSAAGLLP